VFIHIHTYIHAYSYYNYWQREFVNVNGYFLLTKEINIRDKILTFQDFCTVLYIIKKGWYFFS